MRFFQPDEAIEVFWQSLAKVPDRPILVGVSGGPDSLALLQALLVSRERYPQLQLMVAHLNHSIRGEQAEADAKFVSGFCQQQNLPCHVTKFDVPSLAQQAHLSLEDAARQARYAFLGELAATSGAELVLVGHNADDQAETLLMRLLRGTGPQGLAGIAPLAPLPSPDPQLKPYFAAFPKTYESQALLGRPFVNVWRREIEAYCAAHALTPRRDETNYEELYLRNRIRHNLIPLLEKEYQPNIKTNLSRLAELNRAEQAWLSGLVEKAFQENALTRKPGQIEFKLDYLRNQPLALQRRLLRRAIQELQPLQDIDAAHVEAVIELLKTPKTGQLYLPGPLLCYRGKEYLRLSFPRIEDKKGSDFYLELPVPGLTTCPDQTWQIKAEVRPIEDFEELESWKQPDRYHVRLDYDKIGPVLIVRPRLPGERFRPLGAPGRRKVQDVMLDAGIPRDERATWPILLCPAQEDKAETICWIPGVAIGEDFKVTEESEKILDLQFLFLN